MSAELPDPAPLIKTHMYSTNSAYDRIEKKTDFDTILKAVGGFGKQQKILFSIQCVVSLFYAFILFGTMFMTLTPPDHWCSPTENTRHLLMRRMAKDMYEPEVENSPRSSSQINSSFNDNNYDLEGLLDASRSKLVQDDGSRISYQNLQSSNLERRQYNFSLNNKNIVYDNSIINSEEEISNVEKTIPDDVDEFLKHNYIRRMTIPKTADGSSYEQCVMYNVPWEDVLLNPELDGPDPSWPTTHCTNGWDYDFTLYYPSISSENNWVCDQSRKIPFAQAMFFIGSVVGGPLFGWLADARGRKAAFIASNLLAGVAGVASAMSTSLLTFSASLFVLGFNAYPQINILYILVMEFVTTEHRSFVAMIPFTIFLTIGFTILPWLAYFVANWRILGVLMYGPLMLTPLLWWTIPESVRWLVGKGNQKEAAVALENVARVNGVIITESFRCELKEFLGQQATSSKVTVWDLLKLPRLRKHFIALSLLLISVRLLYDAHVRITRFIEYNIFITFSVASALEAFAGLAAYILADKVGRRSTTVAMFFVSAVVELTRAIFNSSSPYLHMALHFVGKLSITTAINIVFMFPVEVLPTVARSQTAGFIHTLGFAITFLSPYIVYLAETCRECALFVLAAVALIGGLTCLFMLPETRGCDLPNTLQEGEDFCRYQPRFWSRSNSKSDSEPHTPPTKV